MQCPGLNECAAIGVPPKGGGPTRLIVFVVLSESEPLDKDQYKKQLQKLISANINPLFRVFDVVPIDGKYIRPAVQHVCIVFLYSFTSHCIW